MNIMKLPLLTLYVALSLSINLYSQSPGLIIRPAGGPYSSILDPNQDGFTSVNTSGYSGNDIGSTYSEIPYKVVPPIVTEPTGDLATGPSGGFTDIVKTVDNSGFYVYSDGTNILFRLRIGSVISGSKGYSILLDTDGKMGSSGPYADPNYVAPTNTSNGNPGFEYEVVLETNFRVAVYNVDGTQNPVLLTSYSLNTNSLISVALSTDSNNPDYFYDFAVPLSSLGSPSSFRMVATTVTSPSSALQGSRSDIYGIDDAANPNPSIAWQTVINSEPTSNITDIGSGGPGLSATCTAAPTINSPINTGSGIAVTGGWTRLDATKPSTATITLYKNGSSIGTTTVISGNTWTITVASIATGDVFYAKAQASGESMCLQSASVTAGCISVPAVPVLTCASSKGISGTIPAGSTILIYLLPTSTASATSNPLTTNITYPTSTSFAFYQNGCSGGTNNVANGTYMLIASNGGCNSAPVFECISSGSSALAGLSTNSLSLTTPVYPYQTTISGTGAASGNILRLFINGQYSSTITATGSSFSFTGLSLKASDQLKIYAYTGSTCMTVSNAFIVSCYTQSPVITTNASGQLVSTSTSINGSSIYPGAQVTLYKGTSPSGVSVGTATTNSGGSWTVSPLTLTAGDNYYATITTGGCASSSSSSAAVLNATTVCPTITGTYTETSTSVAGTLPSSFTGTVRLYLDGVLNSSVAVTGATTWTISTLTYPLYPGAVLTVTAQATGSAENFSCASSATVGCTSPLTPVITPFSTTIPAGQTVTFNVSNITSGSWYALLDNTGASYATSIYKSTTSSFNLVTKVFNTPGTYNLNLSADKLSGCAASFQSASIIVSSILPVRLLNFRAAYQKTGNELKWTTGSEQNTSVFEIERSIDGSVFSLIGIAKAAGNSNETLQYNYTDANPVAGKNYYRLKMVDVDGHYEYSNVEAVLVSVVATVSVTPNPFVSNVKVTMTLSQSQQVIFSLSDVAGKEIIQKKMDAVKGINYLSLDGLNYLTNGVYILNIHTASGSTRKKIIKYSE